MSKRKWTGNKNPLLLHREERHSTTVVPSVVWWKFAEIYDYAEELQRDALCGSTSPEEESDMYKVGNVLKSVESAMYGGQYVIVTEEHVDTHTFVAVTLNDRNGVRNVGRACEWTKGSILWRQSSLLEASNA